MRSSSASAWRGRARDRRAHGVEIERAPARADVLVGPEQVAACRARVVALARPGPSTSAIAIGVGRGAVAADLHARGRGSAIARSAARRVRRDGIAEREQRERAAQVIEQPVAAGTASTGASAAGAPGTIAPREARRASGVLSGDVGEHRGHRQAAAVDEPARERVPPRERQHRVAERARHRALRRDEVGRARRVADVLVGRRDRARRRSCRAARSGAVPAQHERELPDEVVDVLDAAVRAARAERRHQVRGVAGEQHAAVAELLHAPALERVDARPLDLELARRRRASRAGAAGSARASSPPRDRRPSRAGSRCARRRRPAGAAAPTGCGWNGGSNQNQRSGGKVRLHLDVGDQEAVAEHLPLGFEPEHRRAPGCARRRDDQPVAASARSRHRACRRAARRRRRAASTPTTLFFQRSSAAGSAAARSTRYSST